MCLFLLMGELKILLLLRFSFCDQLAVKTNLKQWAILQATHSCPSETICTVLCAADLICQGPIIAFLALPTFAATQLCEWR